MPVDQTHEQYQAHAPLWRKCRDAAQGQESIHRAGKAYLPLLSGQSPAEYEAYKSRALFYNAVGRTIDGLSGLIFRKPPLVAAPASLKPFLADVDASGLPLAGFAEEVVEDLLQVGRAGVLVDFSAGSAQGLTAQQARALGRRVIWNRYAAEDILDWRVSRLNNLGVLTQVRLREKLARPSEGDEFQTERAEQIRVLELTSDKDGKEEPADGPYYRQRVFRRAPGGEWRLVEKTVPRMNGRRLGFIPFVFAGPRGGAPAPAKPPLLDLVNANLSHYRLMADYRHALHFTGLPTPVVTGHNFDPEGGELKIGSASAWVFAEPDAKAFFLEFKGAGLGAMKNELEALEVRMAMLGSRSLLPEKRAAEAAQTANIHRAAESSLLASLAASAGMALTRALEIARDWGGHGRDEVRVQLNTDYLPQSLGAPELKALSAALQQGAISWDTFVYNLAQGEILPPGRTAREERDLIAEPGGQAPGQGAEQNQHPKI